VKALTQWSCKLSTSTLYTVSDYTVYGLDTVSIGSGHGQRLHSLADHRCDRGTLRRRLSCAQCPRRLSSSASRRRYCRPTGRPTRSQYALLLDRRAQLRSGTMTNYSAAPSGPFNATNSDAVKNKKKLSLG